MPNDSNKLLFLTIAVADEKEVRETEKAWGIPTDEEMIWLPKSRTQELQDNGEFVQLWCESWLVIEKGLDAYIDSSYEPTLFEMN